MTRLQPHSAESWGWLAIATLAGPRRPEAKAALRRALDLDPAYGWAGMTLFDAHLEDGELGEAEAVLRLLRAHDAGAT